MHEAHRVVGAGLRVCGDGLPVGDRELDQYLGNEIRTSCRIGRPDPNTFSSLPNDIESIADSMRGCS